MAWFVRSSVNFFKELYMLLSTFQIKQDPPVFCLGGKVSEEYAHHIPNPKHMPKCTKALGTAYPRWTHTPEQLRRAPLPLPLPYRKPCCCWASQSMLTHTHHWLATASGLSPFLDWPETSTQLQICQMWKHLPLGRTIPRSTNRTEPEPASSLPFLSFCQVQVLFRGNTPR